MRDIPPKTVIAVFGTFAVLATVIHFFGYHSGRRVSATNQLICQVSAGLESYKADHGRYPSDPATSDVLLPNSTFDPALYKDSSSFLYKVLSGDSDGNPATSSPADTQAYVDFQRESLYPNPPGEKTHIVDEWGNSIGYSTFRAANPGSAEGYNATFDLWSTGTGKTPKDRHNWMTNW